MVSSYSIICMLIVVLVYFSLVKTKISLASFLMRETSSRDDPRRGKIMRDHKKCMIKMNDHRAIITVIIAYITL